MEADAYMKALEHELEGYKAAGDKPERVKAVEAEIARVKKSGEVTPPPPKEKAVPGGKEKAVEDG